MQLIMNTHRYSLILLAGLLTADVAAQVTSTPVTLRIDPAQSQGAPVSSVFESVEFIPLETNRESLFGQIHSMRVIKDRFIIHDRETNAVLIFGSDGKFLHKIAGSRLGKGGTHRGTISSFSADPENATILLKEGSRQFYYGTDGKFLREDTLGFINSEEAPLGQDAVARVLYDPGPQYPDTTCNELFVTRGHSVIAGYFPYQRQSAEIHPIDYIHISHASFYPAGMNGAYFFTRPYDYNVYRISATGMDTAFRVKLPLQHTLPPGFLKDPALKNTRFQYLMNHPDFVFHIGNVYTFGNLLFFKLATVNGGLKHNDSFVMELNSGRLVSVNQLIPDAASHFLPVTDDANGVEFINSNFLDASEGYLYTNYAAVTLFGYQAESASKQAEYPAKLASWFQKGNKKANPVIIKLKPKQQL